MAYFTNFPDILLPSFTDNRNSSTDFVKSKNLFKRAKIRDDIFRDAVAFEEFAIQGDDRPDNVAFKAYGDSNLDWVVLLSNNILNVRDEWPMSDTDLNRYLDNKYTQEHLNDVHHYETKEIVHPSTGALLLSEGLVVDSTFQFNYYDQGNKTKLGTEVMGAVTNYQYEVNKNDAKRTIYLLRTNFLTQIFLDMKEIMRYTDSSQYIDSRTKKGDNLRVLSPR
tara:strand:+ start:2106 stop:2771 length:666 start_codon:yes stop_codon:yes gene_type:complete